MRRIQICVLSFLLFSSAFLGAQQDRLQLFSSQLDSIADGSLKQTLQNSIVAGLIENQHDFDLAVSQAEAAANRNNPVHYSAYGRRDTGAVVDEIRKLTEPLSGLDRDAVKVAKNPKYKTGEDYLFADIKASLPGSYEKGVELCNLFNPKNGTNDAARLDKDIDAFLDAIKDDPVIKYALSSTSTSMQDLKKNWFGSGRGFEHVVAGEIDGKKVSGYHWWYKFYFDERAGKAQVRKASADIGNPHAFTGSFNWDPDGDGPLPNALKPTGGFSIGNSAQVILALGHIAIEVARKNGGVPGALRFRADINGEEYNWQLYTMNGNIRSLYPMGSSRTQSIDEEYYECEKEFMSSDSSEETLH
ncbi:MAG: hypothetical protein CVV42_12050 [Candidatus Riflebacteria bacterium HGW-Riflebacteria-2]|jgi:hypothetical protein|nr:MAG: hypothetical protein CVV42_12050 [Candidatus Riflebacteria bacterium HGW-Riflebacteria-2]